MALSITFRQWAPKTTKFGKIMQNKGRFAVQGHSRSPILVIVSSFISERTTLRSLYAIGRPSVVCLSVVCL